MLLHRGFERCTEWRSCYYHKVYKIFLIVYVDDFKMAGTPENLKILWEQIREPAEIDGKEHKVVLDDPEPIGRFLWCNTYHEHHAKLLQSII